VDQRPDEKCPWGRCDIRLFAVGVHALRDGGYVQAKVEEIDEYVQDLGNSQRELQKKGAK